jgi:hypothetical protein
VGSHRGRLKRGSFSSCFQTEALLKCKFGAQDMHKLAFLCVLLIICFVDQHGIRMPFGIHSPSLVIMFKTPVNSAMAPIAAKLAYVV